MKSKVAQTFDKCAVNQHVDILNQRRGVGRKFFINKSRVTPDIESETFNCAGDFISGVDL